MIHDLVTGPGWDPGVLAWYFFHQIQEWVKVECVPCCPPFANFPPISCKFFEGRGQEACWAKLPPHKVSHMGLDITSE